MSSRLPMGVATINNLPDFLGRRHYALEDYLYIESISADPAADYGTPPSWVKMTARM